MSTRGGWEQTTMNLTKRSRIDNYQMTESGGLLYGLFGPPRTETKGPTKLMFHLSDSSS